MQKRGYLVIILIVLLVPTVLAFSFSDIFNLFKEKNMQSSPETCPDLDNDGFQSNSCGGTDCYDSLTSTYIDNTPTCYSKQAPTYLDLDPSNQADEALDHTWFYKEGTYHLYLHTYTRDEKYT